MFVALEQSSQIVASEAELRATVRNELKATERKNIGWQGGTIRNAGVHHDGEYWYWSRNWPEDGASDRFHNWFGHFDANRDLHIGVEINVSRHGVDGGLAGLFARDTEGGQVYLFHTGAVGGGTSGVGKTAFVGWFNDCPMPVSTSDGPMLAYPIVPTTGRNILPALRRYLNAVRDFKQAAKLGLTNTPAHRTRAQRFRDYYSEPRGRRKGRRSPAFDYVTRHGEIVDKVVEWRRRKGELHGARIVKNTYIDVGVMRAGKLTELFEIKPAGDRQSIYTAIGQLLVHGADPKCDRRILVIAHDVMLPADISGTLKLLDIEVLRVALNAAGVTVLA